MNTKDYMDKCTEVIKGNKKFIQLNVEKCQDLKSILARIPLLEDKIERLEDDRIQVKEVYNQAAWLKNELTKLEREYNVVTKEVENQNKLTQDLLHELELKSETDNDMLRVARELKEMRHTRRAYKDVQESLNEFIEYYIANRTGIDTFFNKLNRIKVQKDRLEKGRTYVNRIKEGVIK